MCGEFFCLATVASFDRKWWRCPQLIQGGFPVFRYFLFFEEVVRTHRFMPGWLLWDHSKTTHWSVATGLGGVWLANHNKPTILRELGRNPAFFLTENDEICNLRSYPTSWNFWPKGPLKEAKQGAKPAWREHVRNATATANMYWQPTARIKILWVCLAPCYSYKLEPYTSWDQTSHLFSDLLFVWCFHET